MRDRRQRAETLIRLEQERAPHGFVGGLDVQSEGSQTLSVHDAAEGTNLGRVPVAHPRDVEKAAAAAREAHAILRREDREERARALESLAQIVADALEDLAILECLQTGRSYRDVREHDLELGIRTLRLAASWVRARTAGETYPLAGHRTGYVDPAAHPIWGVILPTAEPLGAALRATALSVAAGSGVILLAPPEAPLSVLRLAALSRESSLPGGTLNVLTGEGRSSAELLAESPDIDALAYSGPLDLARRVLVGAAKSNLKPVVMEIDSKVPCLVLENADVTIAVDAVFRSGLCSPCQTGRGVGRVLVHESLYTDFASRLTHLAKSMVIGHPLDEHTELGAVCSEARMKRVLAYVELGRREGATLVAGGGREIEGARIDGSFVQPTVFVDPPGDGRLVREPTGGPVVTVERFRDEAQAVERAGSSLGRNQALIFARSESRGRRVASKLDFGTVAVNGPLKLQPELPHAGAGESSAAKLGQEGWRHTFTRPRTLIVS